MKKIFFTLAIVCFSAAIFAQNLPINKSTNLVTYIEVIEEPKMDASGFERETKKWANEQGFTLLEEEAGSKLVYKGYHEVSYNAPRGGLEDGRINFSFSVFFKDGKYRVIVTDFVHEGEGKNPDGGALENTSADCGPTKMVARSWVHIKNKADSMTQELIDSLEQHITEVANDPANNDDW